MKSIEKDKLRKKMSCVSQDIAVTNQRRKLNLKCSKMSAKSG